MFCAWVSPICSLCPFALSWSVTTGFRGWKSWERRRGDISKERACENQKETEAQSPPLRCFWISLPHLHTFHLPRGLLEEAPLCGWRCPRCRLYLLAPGQGLGDSICLGPPPAVLVSWLNFLLPLSSGPTQFPRMAGGLGLFPPHDFI